MPGSRFGIADEDDFAKMAEILTRNGFELRQKSFAYDSYASAGVVEDVFVVVRFGLGVGRNGHGADFYRAEEAVEKFRRVEKQEEHAFFGTDAEITEGVADPVGTLEQLLVGDTLAGAFDGDVFRAPFEDVAVHEICSDVELSRQSSPVAALFVRHHYYSFGSRGEKTESETSLPGRGVDSIRSRRFLPENWQS